MKKTLVAFAVTAFVASSAQALTVYEKDGSKVDFDGSLRLLLSKESSKVTADGKKFDYTRGHSNLKNDGTRFGVKVKHELGDDFYALGRLEFRFNGNSKSTDQFGDLYAKRAYVGLGSKQFGEVTFGNQVTIGDEISQAGFDNTHGVVDTTLTTSGRSVVRYDYKGIEGLHLGVNYNFAQDRDDNNEVVKNKVQNGVGVGAIYELKLAEDQTATFAAGYTRDSFASEDNSKRHDDAWYIGTSYEVGDLTLALDGGQRHYKNLEKGEIGIDSIKGSLQAPNYVKATISAVAVGAKYKVAEPAAVYGNYAHVWTKAKDGKTTDKVNLDRFMLGTEYQFHKSVKAFVEGSYERAKVKGINAKVSNKAIGVGLRVYW